MSASSTVDYLREQRDQPTVLKAMLSNLREKHPCKLVIVLEGPDDLPVYEVWINKGLPGLIWEPMLAKGKRNAFAFFDLLERDTTGLKTCTYFIIDHDYDGLNGRVDKSNLYILPAHSIENYLASDDVVDSILRTDFRVIGDVELRTALVELYGKLKSQFFSHVEEPCAKLYGARLLAVGNVVVQESVMACFELTLSRVTVLDSNAVAALVRTDQPVPADAVASGREFVRTDPALWTRGKYIYAFFKAFLALLYADRRSANPKVFPDAIPSLPGIDTAFNFGGLSARSPIPHGLIDQIRGWSEDCIRNCESAIAA